MQIFVLHYTAVEAADDDDVMFSDVEPYYTLDDAVAAFHALLVEGAEFYEAPLPVKVYTSTLNETGLFLEAYVKSVHYTGEILEKQLTKNRKTIYTIEEPKQIIL
jgi:hypothetical protein